MKALRYIIEVQVPEDHWICAETQEALSEDYFMLDLLQTFACSNYRLEWVPDTAEETT